MATVIRGCVGDPGGPWLRSQGSHIERREPKGGGGRRSQQIGSDRALVRFSVGRLGSDGSWTEEEEEDPRRKNSRCVPPRALGVGGGNRRAAGSEQMIASVKSPQTRDTHQS